MRMSHLGFFGFMVMSTAFGAFYAAANGNGESTGGGNPSATLLLVINYPYQVWSTDPTKIHVTLFKPDFKPARGALVTVNGKEVGKTDANGTCIFNYVPGSGASHTLKATLSQGGVVYSVQKSFSSNSRTESFRADMLYVYADRGVYNPGQQIMIRVIAWSLKGEYSPVAKASVQLLLQDKGGKVFSGEYVSTNEYGIAESKIELAENMPEGDYELVVLYEKARETAGIRVKRFVPPTIDIAHDLARYMTDVQTSLNAKVSLSYFAGGIIASSKLLVSVVSPGGDVVWKREYASVNEYAVTLDKKDLDSIRPKLAAEADFKIRLRATDSSGQSDEVEWDMTYTARPYTCVIELDKDSYPEGEKVQALAKITDIDRQPAKKIPLSFEIAETGFRKETATDDKGVAVVEFVMPARSVTLTVSSSIVKQALASRSIPYEAPKPMISKVSEPPKGAGQKTTVTVNFDPGYIPIEKVVHVDLTDVSGALVASGTIPVSREASGYIAKGEIVSPTWGSMLVNLYVCAIEKKNEQARLSALIVGFITEGQHVTFYADRELEIVVDNFKPELAPGAKTKFSVSVKGGEGEKCLGVSVTDAAVLSLLDPFVKEPVDHFYNPQAKVISTGGAGVLTWPVVDRNWGSPWRDIAYSDWGWKSPGALVAQVTETEGKGGGMQFSEAMPPTAMKSEATGAMEMEDKSVNLEKEKKADGDTANLRSKDGRGEQTQAEEKTIVIRTRFPETAYWNPTLLTKDGKASFEVDLPDEITTQSISILATDKSGYIGLERIDVKVTQPVFIRSLLPASMKLGDRIVVQALVRNTTGKDIACKLRLDSKDLRVSGNPASALSIPALGARIAEWEISAERCGSAAFDVTADTDSFSDTESKTVMVLPSGEPEVTEITESVKGGGRLVKQFTLHADSVYKIVNLNVSLPNVFPAIEAWWAYGNASWFSPWNVAARAIMNSAMLTYTRTLKGKSDYVDMFVALLAQASSMLVSSQLASGAWGFYPVEDLAETRDAEKTGNLYYTIYCLRALAEIKKAGIEVSNDSIVKAMSYILSKKNDKGLWSSKGAYFWDSFNDDTDMALSAEAFEVLMLALSQAYPQSQLDNDLRGVKDKMSAMLAGPTEEPLAVSACVQGLVYWKKITNDASLASVIAGGIDRLIKIKRTGHWEPHWYHAYGGMVELNARIMSLLAEYDAKKYASFLREGVTWLLSTRTSWGAWHNEIGTANAIAALLDAGIFAEEIPSEITISVNGKEVEKLKVDPKDPFLSSAKLAFYEITKWCTVGENTVSVGYTGKLEASVLIGIQEWRGKSVSADSVSITRKVPASAAIGQPVTVGLSMTPAAAVASLRIEESIPSNAEPDSQSLDKLVAARTITGYRILGNTLVLYLENVSTAINLSYKLAPVRKGKSIYGSTKAFDSESGELVGIQDPGQYLTVN